MQAVKTFVNTADDADNAPKVDKGQPKYGNYQFSENEWKLLVLIQKVFEVCPLLHLLSRTPFFSTLMI